MSKRFFAAVAFTAALGGCGRGLPSGTEKVDFSSLGLNLAIDAPRGGKTAKDSVTGTVGITWGDHGESGSMHISPGAAPLGCTAIETDCKVIEQYATSSIVQAKFMQSEVFHGISNVTVKSATFNCGITVHSANDARRLITACDSAAATGPLKATPASTTASPTALGSPNVPIELEPKSIDVMKCNIKLPKGAKTLTEDKYSSTYSLPLPDKLSEINVQVVGFGESSLEGAKKSATRIGSEVVSAAKKLDSGLLEVVTEPRGVLQSVHVFWPNVGAVCSGPPAHFADLVTICESLASDKGAPAKKAAVPAKKK